MTWLEKEYFNVSVLEGIIYFILLFILFFFLRTLLKSTHAFSVSFILIVLLMTIQSLTNYHFQLEGLILFDSLPFHLKWLPLVFIFFFTGLTYTKGQLLSAGRQAVLASLILTVLLVIIF